MLGTQKLNTQETKEMNAATGERIFWLSNLERTKYHV